MKNTNRRIMPQALFVGGMLFLLLMLPCTTFADNEMSIQINENQTLYNPCSADNLSLYAYSWTTSDSTVVSVEPNGRYCTIRGLRSGKATVSGILSGSVRVPNTGTKWNINTKRWESYVYYTYTTVPDQTCLYQISVGGTALSFVNHPINTQAASGDRYTFVVDVNKRDVTYAWYYKLPAESGYTRAEATGSTLAGMANARLDGMTVYCEVTDSDQITIQSKKAKLTVSCPELVFPSGTIKIDVEAFAGCGFEKLVLPDGLKRIGSRAFRNCTALAYVSIPASVESIAADAFEGCTGICIECDRGTVGDSFAQAHGFGIVYR